MGTLREHGDHGLGTFEHLDGEMVVVDGRCFQVRSDGSVHEVADDVLSPFAVVTHFVPQDTIAFDDCRDLAHLMSTFDRLRHTDNFFFAVRVDGHFDYVKTRAMCKTAEGVPLVVAAAHQPEFECENLAGTLVGFWTPEYAKTVNIPGYHLHFLSQDHQHGGHLLQCRGRQLRLQSQREGFSVSPYPRLRTFSKPISVRIRPPPWRGAGPDTLGFLRNGVLLANQAASSSRAKCDWRVFARGISHIPTDLVVAKRPRMWRATRALISCCCTTLGDASSPDKISKNLNNINDLKFYH